MALAWLTRRLAAVVELLSVELELDVGWVQLSRNEGRGPAVSDLSPESSTRSWGRRLVELLLSLLLPEEARLLASLVVGLGGAGLEVRVVLVFTDEVVDVLRLIATRPPLQCPMDTPTASLRVARREVQVHAEIVARMCPCFEQATR